MSVRIFPISRWLVVDDSKDDIEDVVLAIEGLGGKVDSADSIKAAEKLLRKNIYDVCVIDCFYKGSTKWGADLLPELRTTLPALPVIMISSSDDLELPGKIIRAGADAFCPKLRDSFSMTKALGSAALQAVAVRKLKVMEYDPRSSKEIFMLHQTKDSLEHSIRRKEERLLICGAPGTGKTKISQLFSQQFLKQNYGSISRNIVYHSCASKDDDTNAQLLFGIGSNTSISGNNILQLTLFERSVGGILILDDIEFLSIENQNKLKSIFDNEFVNSISSDTAFPISLIKCVMTCGTNRTSSIVPGFLEAFAHREIDLPSISDLGSELSNAVEFVLKQFLDLNIDLNISYTSDVIIKILDLASFHLFSANFRTLHQIIENALTRALADRRSQIYANDIEIMGSMKTGEPSTTNIISKSFARQNIEVLDGRFGEALLRLVAMGENFDEAKDLLRKIMINVASKKHCGNKSKVASFLGISRQSLYDHEENE